MPGIVTETESLAFRTASPSTTVAHIDNCSFSAWYPTYRRHCPRTRLIRPLPQAFIDYLLADGIVLPADADDVTWEGVENDSSTNDYDDDDEEQVDPADAFRDLHNQIIATIKELGGAVMPKLNWSAPKDAAWISTSNNLKCISPSDIYLLLQASSYIVHDLTEAYSACDERPSDLTRPDNFELVLRQWFAVNPALEFRCFVKDRHLIGITQRDMNYYDFLGPLKQKLYDTIQKFFGSVLQKTFPDSSFVFDVYIPQPLDKVWLIDINPFAQKTDTLLYSWDILRSLDPLQEGFVPELRLVDHGDSSRGFGSVEHSESHVPKDFVESGLDPQAMGELIASMRNAMSQQQNEDDSEDDSDAGLSDAMTEPSSDGSDEEDDE